MQTSINKGKTWQTYDLQTTGPILIIGPGAGTRKNYHEYCRLHKKYDVIYKSTASVEGSFKFPRTWQHLDSVDVFDIEEHPDDTLVGLARQIGLDIIANKHPPPSVVICGSQGGQIVIGLLWKYFWRGVSVIINGGCLTTTNIPKGVVPIIITMTNDHFVTNSTRKVVAMFAKHSMVDGVLVHSESCGHTPKFPKNFLVQICDHIKNQGKRVSQSAILCALTHDTVVTKFGQVLELTTRNNARRFCRVTVESSESLRLRSIPSKILQFVKDHRVNNGDQVRIKDTALDEDYSLMVNIGKGWIYAANIYELA